MISFEAAKQHYAKKLSASQKSGLDLNYVTASQPRFDFEQAKLQALLGVNWHNNMIRAVASLISKGMSEAEIHQEMAQWTLPGYSQADTYKDVQVALNGALKKGFAPNSEKTLPEKPPLLQHISDIRLEASKYLVSGLLEEQSLAQLFGDPGSGKSFLAIDIACAVGSGKDFHSFPTKKATVVYVAGEGRKGIIRRVHAWSKFHGVDLADITLFVSRTAIGINAGHNLEDFKKELRNLPEPYDRPGLIVIDTLARNFGNGDENDTKDMTAFIAEVDKLSDEFSCATLLVHHAGHGDKNRGRGSSALKGALDTEYKISKSEDRLSMSCTKMKDDDEPPDMGFYLIPVDLGNDEVGSPISSAALEYRGKFSPESSRLTKSEWFAVKTFREAANEEGEATLDLNPVQLNLDVWKKYYFKRATHEKHDSKRKAFDRVRQSLQAKGWLHVEDNLYTLTPRTFGQSMDNSN